MQEYPIIVIGAGAGGLVVAIGAAKAGKKVLLIEKGNYGGDCTNFGCIPSKSVIASACHAHSLKAGADYGLQFTINNPDFSGALARARNIVSEIRSHEDPEALAKLKVDTLTGIAHFISPNVLHVLKKDGSEAEIMGKQIVIAAGTRPFIPTIPGIHKVPYLTNETIFQLERIPEHLAILGGGPVGCELAQAFQRLGSKVTIIQKQEHLLIKEEKESQLKMEDLFRQEGIELFLNQTVVEIKENQGKIDLIFDNGTSINASHLLVATGRKANIESLNLSAASVKTYPKGIVVDAYGRTSQSHIWAVGDITGQWLFTHMAEQAARCVLWNLLFPWPFKRKIQTLVPRVTFTDPEIASVGLLEKEAVSQYGSRGIAVYQVPYSQVDRAITAGRTEGFVKIITKKWSSKILGASIVSPHAGEMLMEIILAMKHGIPLRKLADVIHPYPTYSLAIRKAADLWLSQTILPTFIHKGKS